MKHIFVSPHSDDVALSCGGQIIAATDEVLVLNVFTSEGERAVGTEGAFFDAIVPERKLEDKASWASLGIEPQYADLPEALLRGAWPFLLLQTRDDAVIGQRLYDIARSLIAAHPGATFHFPAGIGNHVDHLLCRKVGLRLLDTGQLDTIHLYEDVPYSWLKFLRDQFYRTFIASIDHANMAEAYRSDGVGLVSYLLGGNVPFPRGRKLFAAVYSANALRSLRGRFHHRSKLYRAHVVAMRLSDEVIERKVALLRHYRSQIPMLFGDPPEATLRDRHQSLSHEVTIEIRRFPAPGQP